MICKLCNITEAKVKGGRYKDLCLKCRRKIYYKDHLDKERELCKKWYAKNAESEIEKNKEYRKQNRELFDWYHNKDRFNGIRELVLKRDGYKCTNCKTDKKIVIHHKDGKGYSSVSFENMNNDINNLITLCSSCHTKLHWEIRKQKRRGG